MSPSTNGAEVFRKRLAAGPPVEVAVQALAGPDDFSDLAGSVQWKKSAQEYKDELRRRWSE